MFTPPNRPLLGLVYISMGAGDVTGGSVVMEGTLVMVGLVLMMYLLSKMPPMPPEDSDLGRRKGSIIEVEEGGWGGPGVLGLEEGLPFVLLARLCFLYLTCNKNRTLK